MAEKDRCPLCGDDFHPEADTEDWMGLYCPSVNAPEQDQQAFRSALAKTWAEEFAKEVRTFFEWEDGRPARNAAWDARSRADGLDKSDLPGVAIPSQALQEDCTQRTVAEITRQKREEVFQPYGEFEIDVPHLTVKGQAPQPRLVQASTTEQRDPDDALLYVDPSQDVP